jgi:hypothetical protein
VHSKIFSAELHKNALPSPNTRKAEIKEDGFN